MGQLIIIPMLVGDADDADEDEMEERGVLQLVMLLIIEVVDDEEQTVLLALEFDVNEYSF